MCTPEFDSNLDAIRYKKALDETGLVTIVVVTEVRHHFAKNPLSPT